MKLNLQTAVKTVVNAVFGEWNGIQAFLYPTTLLYLVNSFSFLYWMSSIFTKDQHYLPLTLFMFVLLFVSFMIIKFYSFRGETVDSKDNRNDMTRFLIEFHRGLLLIIIVSAFLYLLYEFMSYFYGIQLPIKKIYAHFLQYISITLIVFYYIQSVWTRPYRKQGMSYPRAIRHVMVFARHNITSTLMFTAMLILMIVSSAKLFHLLIVTVISPVIDLIGGLMGFPIRPELMPVFGIGVLFYNIFLIVSIFIVSNLIYAPIVALFSILIQRFHPVKIREENAEIQASQET